MFGKSLGILVFLLPFTIHQAATRAESWKDWVQDNPTYNKQNQSQPSPQSPTTQPKVQTSPQPSSGTPSSSQPKRNPVTSPTNEVSSTRDPIFEQQFLAGCQQSARHIEHCHCALREIQNNYTFQEFVTIIQFVEQNNEIPDEIWNIALKCVS